VYAFNCPASVLGRLVGLFLQPPFCLKIHGVSGDAEDFVKAATEPYFIKRDYAGGLIALAADFRMGGAPVNRPAPSQRRP
jgi:hypothetical protein